MTTPNDFKSELLALFKKYGIEDVPADMVYGSHSGVHLCMGDKIVVTISPAGWNFGNGFMPLEYICDAK